ncbi:MAG TPA: peptidoglycan-binding protein [Chitinispirillaceae bacterium]|nr:peptidoglycan-binding protein [Chitinispirillaceae bacterium]
MSNEITLKSSELAKRLVIDSKKSKIWTIRIIRSKCIRIEFHDLLFTHNSAVLLPQAPVQMNGTQNRTSWDDNEIIPKFRNSHFDSYQAYKNGTQESSPGNGFDTFMTLAAMYSFLADNPQYRLLIAGHTDTSGEIDYNLSLSCLRAESIYFLINEKKDEWVSVCKEKSNVEDYQRILMYCVDQFGWDCNPGNIDNVDGPKTKNAVNNFQQSYNDLFQKNISVDGVVGSETWGAIFDIYLYRLKNECSIDFSSPLPSLTYASDSVPYIGCGETFPVDQKDKDNYRSQSNRRVELLLFDQSDTPDLSCHTEPKCTVNCDTMRCAVYKKDAYTHIPFDLAVATLGNRCAASDAYCMSDCNECIELSEDEQSIISDTIIYADGTTQSADDSAWGFFDVIGNSTCAPPGARSGNCRKVTGGTTCQS